MQHFLSSEFVWGIVVGILLTTLGTFLSHWWHERQRRKAVVRFVEDVIRTIASYVERLDADRQRNDEIINGDYLGLISGEIELYARNREHLINIPNSELRGEIKGFITEVAIKTARIQNSLNEFSRWWGDAMKQPADSPARRELQEIAGNHLTKARTGVDRLMDYMARERVTEKLVKYK